MSLLRNLDELDSLRGCVLSIGNFDGVHRGHCVLLQHLSAQARERQAPAVVLTFEPHPLELLRPDLQVPRLTTLEQKAKLVCATGVTAVVAYPTDRRLLELSAEQFFQQVVVNKFAACGLVEGPNFFFGKDRTGTPQKLQELCTGYDLDLEIVAPTATGDQMVSSSRVREKLMAGDLVGARELLGRFYSLTGIIGQGAQRGRTIGFPTANLTQVETLIPPHGVYAATCEIAGELYQVALNIGPNPTFGDHSQKIEAHVLEFSGNLYGQELTLNCVSRIRSIKTFSSAEELQSQLQTDIAAVQQAVQRAMVTGPANQDSPTAS